MDAMSLEKKKFEVDLLFFWVMVACLFVAFLGGAYLFLVKAGIVVLT
jgi:hypothetical protein